MKPIQLVFCHGFGCDQSFWRHLAPRFVEYSCIFWDLGYFGPEESIIAPNFKNYQVVAVGHSFGGLKLLNYSADFKAVILLQGFSNFLGNKALLNKKRQLQWQEMRAAFNDDPKSTLQQFYDRALGGDKILFQELIAKIAQINAKKLSFDLDQMIIPNQLKCNQILAIGSKDDKIVPPILIKDNFEELSNAKIIMHQQGSHLLGFLQAQFIAKEIKVFLDEIKNKE